MIYDAAVVGAGACGIIAALHLSSQKTILFDNNSGAEKLSITGNNRCNISNCIDLDEFIEHYSPNGNFLRDAFSVFFIKDTKNLLKKFHINTTCNHNRLILKDKTSSYLAETLLNKAAETTVFKPFEGVVDIKKDNGIFIIKTKKGTYFAKNTILACGGKSYPKTGSNGLCYKFASNFGHNIVRPQPFEVPFCSNKTKPLQGLSFYGVELTLKFKNKKIINRGDIVFTHFGISGPAILELSEHNFEDAALYINFANQTEEEFRKELFNTNGKIKNKLTHYLPKRFVDNFVSIDKFTKELSKKEVVNILDTVLRFRLDVKKCSFNRAFVTKGGISLKQINPKTMESTIVKNLFFCGEIMDIQGSIGGFNLQAAFSTGFLASQSINRKTRTNKDAGSNI